MISYILQLYYIDFNKCMCMYCLHMYIEKEKRKNNNSDIYNDDEMTRKTK